MTIWSLCLLAGGGGGEGGGDGDVFEGDYRPVVCHYRHLY